MISSFINIIFIYYYLFSDGPTVHLPNYIATSEFSGMSLECKSDANPHAHHYKWTKQGDGSFLQEDKILKIDSLEAEDAGMYECRATNTLTPSGGIEEDHVGIGSVEIQALCKYSVYVL